MNEAIREVLLSEEEISQRCRELGKQITEDYQDKEAPILVSVLKGSVMFLTELAKRIELDVELEFMCLSSYHGTESTGEVKIVMDLGKSIAGKNVLLIEDIVDTGLTLKEVKKLLVNKGASDVKIVSLLDKPSRRKVEVSADYVGFTIPDEFVVGYGLDFDQKYRNLPFVGILKEEEYQ